MTPPLTASAESSLDPEDWSDIRALGHRMIDDVFDWMSSVRERPAWRPVPEETVNRFRERVPRKGVGADAAYERFQRDILPYPLGNAHPRFWGWVIGSGTPVGVLADLLASTLNPNMSGLRNAGVHVEEQVIDWMTGLFGFPGDASGILVSGGSMANIIGLEVALDANAGFDVGRDGLTAAPRPPVLYASCEAHYSIAKGVRMLGLGDRALRLIPTDDQFRIDLDELERAIARDRAAGLHPFCIVGNAGTVNTGAFDNLHALADLARRERLWLHVDGAFGAMTALSPHTRTLSRGMERADSLAFDFHKWMCVPMEAACILVRDANAHRHAFAASADYLTPPPRGTGHDGGRFANLGPQLTRGFRALKVWMSIQAYGIDRHAELVEMNVAQARHLARMVTEAADFELAAPAPSNVVCFRWLAPGRETEDIDDVNREILLRVQERGIAVPSSTVLRGRFALRVAVTNHRTRFEDFDLFIEAVRAIGVEIVDQG